jgi:hypothetical protein
LVKKQQPELQLFESLARQTAARTASMLMDIKRNKRQVSEQMGLAAGAIAIWACLLLIVLLK